MHLVNEAGAILLSQMRRNSYTASNRIRLLDHEAPIGFTEGRSEKNEQRRRADRSRFQI
jgi:hypothetical protein